MSHDSSSSTAGPSPTDAAAAANADGEESGIHRLYTSAMLAGLLKLPVAVVRRWQRRGLIRPVREVRKLAYFDFQEVNTARRLAELLSAGVSPQAIEKQLAALAKRLPDVKRPLAQLSIVVEGKALLVRQGDGLIEPGGQWRIDFDVPTPLGDEQGDDPSGASEPDVLPLLFAAEAAAASEPARLLEWAAELEDDEQLEAAVDMYRAALAAGGPTPEVCFQLAELLYRTGDISAAIERYYMAIELDANYVEARANLGCVLVDVGRLELAVAAFEGALRYHADYADAHYHLARALDDLLRPDEAEAHWRAFCELSPESPWAHEAHERLELSD